MFIVGYKMRYAHGPEMNGGSVVEGNAVLRRVAELVRSPKKKEVDGEVSRVEDIKMQFVVEPLRAPSVVRPAHEPQVVYVRVAAPAKADGVVAVLPDVAAAVDEEIASAA